MSSRFDLRCASFLAAASLFATQLFAQGVTVGRLTGNVQGFRPASNITLVDLAHPATASGNLTTATVRWFVQSLPTCTGAFKIKILRRAGVVPVDPDFTVVAERGPFDSQAGYITVPLSPPIAVQPNDLIAISQIKEGCGGTAMSQAGPGDSYLQIDGDASGTGTLAGSHLGHATIGIRASADANVLDAVIAAGGAVTGAFGSFFGTSLQLTNVDAATVVGKVVFHSAGVPGSPSDVSMPYSIGGYATLSFPDVVAAMGAAGLGSLDIVTSGSAAPLATVRVFDDQGAAGTKGFTEEALPPGAAMRTDESLSLAIPDDLTNYRVNVGVRTLDAGAEIVVSTCNAAGGSVNLSAKKTYGAHYFEQTTLAAFLDVAPPAGGMATIRIVSGSAIVYWSTTDNRTNDSSIKFAQRP